jgi:hypothetical protein
MRVPFEQKALAAITNDHGRKRWSRVHRTFLQFTAQGFGILIIGSSTTFQFYF